MMWSLCRFGRSSAPEDKSAWCSAFNEEDLRVMDYYIDVDFFYRFSYGNRDINGRIPCPLLQDATDIFELAKEETITELSHN